MKRILLLALCVSGLFTMTYAQKGIRVESRNTPIVVYVDKEQVCTPVNSCFIANLRNGIYNVEVYTERDHKRRNAEPIFAERIHYTGFGIEEININADRKPHRPAPGKRGRLMSDVRFDEFLTSMEKSPFDDSKIDLLKTVLPTTDFTSAQVKQLCGIYSFDDKKIKLIKLIYPNVIDQQNFFIVIDSLVFESSKSEVAKFIEEYHR